jgi:lauroyl/myristoyl acyltransferase
MTSRIASGKSVSAKLSGMNFVIYWLGRAFIAFVQLFPLPLVAQVGRAAGAVAYHLDARHRRVALKNLTTCFGREKSADEIQGIARENFRRLGENYLSAVKTATMSPLALLPHFDLIGAEKILPYEAEAGPQSRVVAIGHFGNFELYARFGQFVPVFKCAATYRALKQPAINRLMEALRDHSGCRFFERRRDGAALKDAMNDTGLLLGLLADQSSKGVRGPFLGVDCDTSTAPAVFALRYHCPLHTAICYRIGLARWRIEVGPEIPTREAGRPRTVDAIVRDMNAALEQGVRRDPANWFWVHRRWKD